MQLEYRAECLNHWKEISPPHMLERSEDKSHSMSKFSSLGKLSPSPPQTFFLQHVHFLFILGLRASLTVGNVIWASISTHTLQSVSTTISIRLPPLRSMWFEPQSSDSIIHLWTCRLRQKATVRWSQSSRLRLQDQTLKTNIPACINTVLILTTH